MLLNVNCYCLILNRTTALVELIFALAANAMIAFDALIILLFGMLISKILKTYYVHSYQGVLISNDRS